MSDWEAVLTGLVQDRGGPQVRYATLLCGNQSNAEDLVQDALIRVFTGSRPPQVEGSVEVGEVEHAEAYVRRTILNLYQALAALPPKQRACVVLRFYDDLTVAEVAASLGITAGTVKRHLHDANARLAASLAPLMEVEPS